MHKLLVFDLDGTLAPLGKGASAPTVRALCDLERAGYRIAICSGKPLYYLCGFARQLELTAPVLVGENGATGQLGIELPPKRFWKHPCTPRAEAQLAALRARINAACGTRVWYQPNEVGLTPFPQESAAFAQIEALIAEDPAATDELAVFRHVDSFDLVPRDVNKYNGLCLLVRELGLAREDCIAVGDGENDLPMFEFCDLSLGIGARVREHVTHAFDSIDAALQFLLQNKP